MVSTTHSCISASSGATCVRTRRHTMPPVYLVYVLTNVFVVLAVSRRHSRYLHQFWETLNRSGHRDCRTKHSRRCGNHPDDYFDSFIFGTDNYLQTLATICKTTLFTPYGTPDDIKNIERFVRSSLTNFLDTHPAQMASGSRSSTPHLHFIHDCALFLKRL